MYQTIGQVHLKDGEQVEAAIVLGPDEEWSERLQKLLSHKGDLWNWQNTEMLREPLDLEARFHILHRDGAPFSHVLVSEVNGVGLLGHVWTEPQDRGNGAASLLMKLVLEQFRARGGQALYLGTAYDSPAFHIYRKLGFEGIEPGSGVMHFFATSPAEFEAEYFAPGETVIEPLDWQHWPVAPALFTGAWPQTVRSTPFGLVGRALTEGPLLPTIRARHQNKNQPAPAMALRKTENSALVGLAVCRPDILWPETFVADIFCHPDYWELADELWNNLPLPENQRLIAYCDATDAAKEEVLHAAGFEPVTTLPRWAAIGVAGREFTDVMVWQRS